MLATNPPSPIRIVIADDHPCMRDGIRSALRKFKHITIVGEAPNGVQLINVVAQKKPHVVFTDIEMPEMDGIEATKIIKQRFPHVKVIAYSAFDTDSYITDMMIDANASGYLLKGDDGKQMCRAIEKVMNGEIYCNEQVAAKLVRLMQQTSSNPMKPLAKPAFTERQLLILVENANELSCKEIALKHNIPLGSVESAKKELLKKTGCRNSVGLALYADRNFFTRL